MDIRPIRTGTDHRAALREIEALMGAKSGSPEGARLDVLVTNSDLRLRGPIEATSEAEFRELLEQNLTAPFRAACSRTDHASAHPSARCLRATACKNGTCGTFARMLRSGLHPTARWCERSSCPSSHW